MRGVCLTFLKPAFFSFSKNASPLGKAATELGRYVYADESLENIFPNKGKIVLK